MPVPNTRNRKSLRPYHVYNRGFNRRKVFVDDDDRRYFLSLLRRHLGRQVSRDERGRSYAHLTPLIVVLAYCLMTTHFHLVVWQREPDGIAQLMNRVLSAYTRYFNKKYGNSKRLFDGPVRAKPVMDRRYFRWLVGYVHDNHSDGVEYAYSSHRAWIDPESRPGWLEVDSGLDVFGGVQQYCAYLKKRDQRRSLDDELF